MIESGVIRVKPLLAESNDTGLFSRIFSKPQDATDRRARRVTVLIAGIIVLSIADLAATIAHLQSVGMVEINPFAALIIKSTNSIWGLVVFKMLSVSLCVVLLYRLRRYIQGEVASWLGLFILVLLILYWGHYADISSLPDALTVRHNGYVHKHWLTLTE